MNTPRKIQKAEERESSTALESAGILNNYALFDWSPERLDTPEGVNTFNIPITRALAATPARALHIARLAGFNVTHAVLDNESKL